MDLNYNYLWPVPIVTSNFHRDLTKEEYNFILAVKLNRTESNGISKDVHLLDCPELSKLKVDLNQYLQQYWKDVFDCKQSIVITNSWIARSQPGEKHHNHEHPNSIVSGVLYVKADEGAGDLKLIHNGPIYDRMEFNYEHNNYNFMNSKSWSFPIRTGDIVLFPSSITHGVTQNSTERIILGFNSFVSGVFGGNYISDLTLEVK
jgi:uncharacterized protein (TIGR02466 family)